MEFSKKIVISIMATYILIVLMCVISQLVLGVNLGFIMDYLNPLLLATIPSYLAKAGVENFLKIKQNNTDNTSVPTTIETNDYMASDDVDLTEGTEDVMNEGMEL